MKIFTVDNLNKVIVNESIITGFYWVNEMKDMCIVVVH